jgi:excisionase family DNA binding protein
MAPEPDEPLPLIGVPEVARRLGSTPRHVQDLAARGVLPHTKVGKFLRFDPQAIERWIEANTHQGASS